MKQLNGFLFLALAGLAQVTCAVENDEVNNVVIIGSGPAGLAAALYLANEGFDPIVIEGSTGGVLMDAGPIENWPGFTSVGPDLMGTMYEQAESHGARIFSEWVTKVDFSKKPLVVFTSAGREFKAHAVIIATGLSPRRLGCPGEQEYWGKGITGCVLCDGPLYRNKPVAVIGGGDLAMGRALFLAKYTNNITIIHHGEALSASNYWQNKVKQNPNIKIIYNISLTEIKGDTQKVTGLQLKNIQTNEEILLPIDGLFVAIGFLPNSDIFKGQVDTASDGCICVLDKFTKTSVEGVFVAGNVADHGYRPAITAAGTGSMAAVDAEDYLSDLLSKERTLHTYCYCRKHE